MIWCGISKYINDKQFTAKMEQCSKKAISENLAPTQGKILSRWGFGGKDWNRWRESGSYQALM